MNYKIKENVEDILMFNGTKFVKQFIHLFAGKALEFHEFDSYGNVIGACEGTILTLPLNVLEEV